MCVCDSFMDIAALLCCEAQVNEVILWIGSTSSSLVSKLSYCIL